MLQPTSSERAMELSSLSTPPRPHSSTSDRAWTDGAPIALRHAGQVEVLTREGTYVGGGKWLRVTAALENLNLRLDNASHPRATTRYAKEMTITAGTTVGKAPQPGRPFCISLGDFNAASGKKRVLDCITASECEKWYGLLSKVATTDLDTLLEPLREAREKERDANELERALAERPAKVEQALLALRRGRLDIDYVARDSSDRGVTALLAAARAGRADIVTALVALGARPDGPAASDAAPPPDALHFDGDDAHAVAETPLLGAVRADSLAATEALLLAGASPTLADYARETPLLAAARGGAGDVATALMQRIALLAAQQQDPDLRWDLVAHIDDEFGLDPSTPLCAGAVAGHANVVAALLLGATAMDSKGVAVKIAADVTRAVNGRTALHHAALRGRPSVVAPLADAGADVDALDGGGNTPLQLALTEGRVATVAALLQSDAAAVTVRPEALTRSGSRRAADLVAKTAELRAALGDPVFDAAHAAELASAVRQVLRDSTGEAVDADADGNEKSELRNFPADVCALAPAQRWTALLRCCHNGDGRGVELWLTLGADANHADHGATRCTPLMACATRGDEHVAKLVLATQRCDIDARDSTGATALYRAAEAAARSRALPVAAAAARDVAALLLRNGADALIRDTLKQKSPLSIAAADARDAHLVIVMLSSQRKADLEFDVDAPHGTHGATALMLAAALPEASAVLRTLLGAHDLAADAALKRRPARARRATLRARLQHVDDRGRTALFYAAEADRAENVELLLSFGRRTSTGVGADGVHAAADEMLDVDAVDASGATALHVATAARAKGAVGALLRFGASASKGTSKGNNGLPIEADLTPTRTEASKRPLSMAMEAGDVLIANTLGRFRAAILAGDDAATLRYVDRGNYEVDEPAGLSDGAPTALIVACRLGHARAAQRLVDAGADANRTDAYGEAPLLAAARSGSLMDPVPPAARADAPPRNLAELLLDAGADVNSSDDELRESPLLVVAAAAFFVGGAARRGDAAALLLRRGADALHADARGYTPLLIASGAWPPFDDGADVDAAAGPSWPSTDRESPDATAVLAALLAHHASNAFDIDLLHSLGGEPDWSTRSAAPPRLLTALGAAAMAGRPRAVAALLRAGANALAKADETGAVALTLAARCGHASVIRVMLDHARALEAGAGPRPRTSSAPDSQETVALEAAVFADHPAAVAALLRSGAAVPRNAPSAPADFAKPPSPPAKPPSPVAKPPSPPSPPAEKPPSPAEKPPSSVAEPPASDDGTPPGETETPFEAVPAEDVPADDEEDEVDAVNEVPTLPPHAFDGDVRPAAARHLAVSAQLDAMRFAIAARDFSRCALLARRGNFQLDRGAGALALGAAAKHGDAVGVDALLSVAPAIAAALGQGALEAAARSRRPDAATALLRKMAAGAADSASLAALLALAVDVGDSGLAALCVGAGGDAALPSDGYAGAQALALTALARAACAPAPRGPTMVKTLLGDDEAGALATLRRAFLAKVPPLHAAAAADRVESLATLLRYERKAVGVRPPPRMAPGRDDAEAGLAFSVDASKHTPLHVASACGAYDAVAVLVALHAADDSERRRLLAAPDLAGAAPLAVAAAADDGAVVALLLGAGALADAKDANGRDARDGCASSGRGADRRLDVMRWAILNADFDAALRLVSKGSYAISTTTRSGETVLTRAAACGRADVIAAALEHAATAAWADGQRPVDKNGQRSASLTPAETAAVTRECCAALSAAAAARQPASAEALLRARGDVLPAPRDASELVRIAVSRRRHALTELLLVRTAEPLAACDVCDRDSALSKADVSFSHDGRVDGHPDQSRARSTSGGESDESSTASGAEVHDSFDAPRPRTTPFVLAVESGDLGAVRIFLDQRVAVFDVDARALDGETALMRALSRGHVAVAHALLAAGADATARDVAGRSALERACFDDAEPKAELKLVRDVCAAVQDWKRRADAQSAVGGEAPAAVGQQPLDAALSLAVAQRDSGAVAALVRAGADPLAPCRDAKRLSAAETPLLRACAAPDLATLGAVLGALAVRAFDVDAPHGETRATALCVCAVAGDADAVALLLAAGADVATQDANKRSALWHASARGHAACVDLLARSAPRAALDAADVDGATPLHAAARVGARGAVAALLAAGADATQRDLLGRTARKVARDCGHLAAAAQLDAMSWAISDGDFAECIRLARNGNWPLDFIAGGDAE
ncbi:ankyrin repeat-containing domain protein [Pelagophyceae sp. CCMP2097]|nr:ankyrin repeat-containing domain protein [Pelagophyceae sp. CCMP2097]